MIAPQTLFAADDEIGVVIFAFHPRKWRRRVETNPFPSESDLACLQNNQEDYVALGSREQRTNTGSNPRIRLHQSWHGHTDNNTRDYRADSDPVRNNEMLEIDECSDDEERNKNPVADRHLPREGLPDREKQKCGKKLHREIAKSYFAPAICATTAEHDPTVQWQILMPGNPFLASRTKRAAGLV